VLTTPTIMIHDPAMAKKTLAAFLGSPRPGGNTDTLTEAVLEGARTTGWETRSFHLRALKVHPCTGCDNCWKNGKRCIFVDDGELLYDAMAQADLFLFATPVYWYGPTAIMKAFLDRLVVFNRPQGRPLVRGKAAVLVSAWEEKGTEAAEPLVKLFELGMRYLEIRLIDRLLVDDLGPKGAALQRPDVLARARSLGQSLS
jgi:multimeric flavodoxin WrbA